MKREVSSLVVGGILYFFFFLCLLEKQHIFILYKRKLHIIIDVILLTFKDIHIDTNKPLSRSL